MKKRTKVRRIIKIYFFLLTEQITSVGASRNRFMGCSWSRILIVLTFNTKRQNCFMPGVEPGEISKARSPLKKDQLRNTAKNLIDMITEMKQKFNKVLVSQIIPVLVHCGLKEIN